jgi:ABC-type Fe3+/spermidine/putrescine transport system ATPase subunit
MIDIINLTVKAGQKTLLQDLNLSVARKEIIGVLGPSGSGKTSLVRAIAGLNTPVSGEIRLSDQTVSQPGRMVPPDKRKTSMVFQSLALWPHMTARRHLEFVMKKSQFSNTHARNEQISSLFERLHLHELQNRYPHELSGGEQQRLAIARALASNPAYLMMDEPFSSLDDILRTELLDITLSLRHTHHMTIVYVTHNIDEALYLADRISIMKNGRLIQHFSNKPDLTRECIIQTMKDTT